MPKKAIKQRLSWVGDVLTAEYPPIGKKLVCDCRLLPEEIYVSCESARHGIKQKLGDAKSGQSAAEKYEEVKAIWAALLEGDWERTAKPDLTPIICEAVARIMGEKLADVEKAAEKGGEKLVKEWGAKDRVKAMILRIRAERAEARAEEDEEDIEIPGLESNE